MSKIVDDLRIVSEQLLSPPAVLKQALPLSDAGSDFIQKSRQEIADIVHGRDPRLLVITGPCSIHDPVAVLEYAERLQKLQEKVKHNQYL